MALQDYFIQFQPTNHDNHVGGEKEEDLKNNSSNHQLSQMQSTAVATAEKGTIATIGTI